MTSFFRPTFTAFFIENLSLASKAEKKVRKLLRPTIVGLPIG